MSSPSWDNFSPDFSTWHYYILIYQDFLQKISDHMTVVLVSFLAGVIALLILQGFLLYSIIKSSPSCPLPKCKEEHKVKIPEFLKSRINQPNLKNPEDCIWLNFMIQFVFSEMKDSLAVRRFITKKIQMEFEDLLKTRTAVFVDELYLRDFSLGETMPVFTSISVQHCKVHQDLIEVLELKAGLDYSGGFQVAIDAALPFGRMAFVSVKVLKLKGTLRLHFTKLPFSHWSMTFYEDPELDLEIVAHLDGRPMSKLKNIIANQIRGLVRKKHTWPNYKIRFKPFFSPRADLETEVDPQIQLDGNDIGNGVLEVTVLSASRLPFVPPGSRMYCTVCVDSLPWKQLMAEKRKNKKIVTLVLVKTPADPALGMVVKDELLPDRLQPVVIIDEVTPNSPAQQAGVHQNDILIGVSGNKVSTAKIAMKSLKWAKDNKIQIQVERDRVHPLEFLNSDATMSRRASSWHSSTTTMTNSSAASTPIVSGSDTTRITGHSKTDDGSHIDHEDFKGPSTGENYTLLADASENPTWGQKFLFVVDTSKKFLNVCIWCKGGDRTDKNEILKHSKHDLLIGYVSLNLDDVYLQCLVTLNGSMHERFKLKHGHYKTADDLIKMWQTHKGWDPNQMYGDILLAFTFYPTSMTEEQRKSYASCKVPDPERGTHDKKSTKSGSSSLPENLHLPDTKLLGKDVHHQFENTTFVSATFCDYCGKKIWMKDAFKCRTCNMVCHKKCLVKCLLNTICTEHGVRKRSSAENDEPWIPLTETGKNKQKIKFDDKDGLDRDKEDETSVLMDLEARDDYVDTVQTENFIDSLANKNDAGSSKTTSSDLSGSRFRILKEQTERMKDLMKHLKRGKVQNPLSDKAIVEAKETGAHLFLDMDTAKRKDKLEGLIKGLDEQLILEMQNKEQIEKEIARLEELDKISSNPKHKAELKALEAKANKSGEKLDAMRLLMLQYCSGLQSCLGAADALDSDQKTSISTPKPPQGSPKFEPPKSARYTVSGFVRRAGTSVKEKVTSIKKDFGRKGKSTDKGEDGPSTSAGANNNKQLNQLTENSFSEEHATLAQDVKTSFRRQRSGADEMCEIFEDIFEAIEEPENHTSHRHHGVHPDIQIKVEDADRQVKEGEATGNGMDPNEPRLLLREQFSLTRSNSDSGLEISKMLSLTPEEILRYRGNSLPKLFVSDDSDSGSDFLVINSSDDEQVVTDSSDNEQDRIAVNFAGDKKRREEDDDDNSDIETEKHHRTTAQQFQTFQV